jgi:hypothetical protein
VTPSGIKPATFRSAQCLNHCATAYSYPPALTIFISARLFSVPQIENEVKRTPVCGCC